MKKNSADFLSLFMQDATRARVLRTLVLNEHEVFTPERVGKRTGMSAKPAKKALIALERLGVARHSRVAAEKKIRGKKQAMDDVWFLDPHFPHARSLAVFVREISPLRYDEVLETLKKSGRLSVVVLSGTFVGDSTRPADIVVAGDSMSERRMETAMRALEAIFGRELRYAAFPTAEFRYRMTVQDKLLRDTFDFPHRILLDRTRSL
jgi:hypothetical protein